MSHTLATPIEIGLRNVARQLMHPDDYKRFQMAIRSTRLVHVGHGNHTLHDLIIDEATRITDWATNTKFSEASDYVGEKKRQAIEKIKKHLHHLKSHSEQ